MSEDHFMKLYKYMQSEFTDIRKEMRTEFDRVHKDIQRVYGIVDSIYRQTEVDDHERAVMGMQIDRHEKRITQLENKSA